MLIPNRSAAGWLRVRLQDKEAPLALRHWLSPALPLSRCLARMFEEIESKTIYLYSQG